MELLTPALFASVMTAVVGVMVWLVKSVAREQAKLAPTLERIANMLTSLDHRMQESDSIRIAALPSYYTLVTKVDSIEGKLIDTIILLAKSSARIEVKEIVQAAGTVPSGTIIPKEE